MFIIINPEFVHSFSSVSAKSITMKRNNTGAIQSPCLTPTLWLIVSLVFPILITTFKSWYILVMEEQSFGGHHISSKSEASECDPQYQMPWLGPQMRHKWVSLDCVLCRVTFYRERSILASNSRWGSKLIFHSMFFDNAKQYFAQKTTKNITPNVHQIYSSPLVGVR